MSHPLCHGFLTVTLAPTEGLHELRETSGRAPCHGQETVTQRGALPEGSRLKCDALQLADALQLG